MSNIDKIPGTTEAWESGQLGEDANHARSASAETTQAIHDALGLQMISIRLNKDLIDTFKCLAEYYGVGYQPLMRDALRRFAEGEMKQIMIANTNRDDRASRHPVETPEPHERKCA